MKINILLVLLITSVYCQAQTKLIAHKSHSGSVYSFSKAYKNNLFDINRSNFGNPGNKTIVVLDSVIAVNNSVTILKIRESNVCYRINTSYKELKKSDFKQRIDTLINHKLLYKNNSVALMKSSELGKYPIRFANPLKEVVFIGFQK